MTARGRLLAPRFRTVLAEHLGSRDVTRVVHGSVLGLALVVALEAHPPPPGPTAATVVGTAVAFGLAEIYAEFVGTETQERRHVRRPEVLEMGKDALAVAFGTGVPAIYFVLAALGALAPATAFTLAKWTGLGLIFAYGFAAARLAGDELRAAVVHGAAIGAVGCALILLKALVH